MSEMSPSPEGSQDTQPLTPEEKARLADMVAAQQRKLQGRLADAGRGGQLGRVLELQDEYIKLERLRNSLVPPKEPSLAAEYAGPNAPGIWDISAGQVTAFQDRINELRGGRGPADVAPASPAPEAPPAPGNAGPTGGNS